MENEKKEPLVYKQVLVWRHDLKVRKGKIAAQMAHASLAAILRLMEWVEDEDKEIGTLSLKKDSPILGWLHKSFSKISVYVENEEELKQVYQAAEDAGIVCALIVDSGRTEFKEPTTTCCAIGPDYANKIDLITGKLKLL